ncbi:hypothetical protein K523DRAFT_75487 [Schizophyllum commune Tattone D]|nr:hypothetical protein K523DRAFT_75487 [Schizophyllum commune Tattone D]
MQRRTSLNIPPTALHTFFASLDTGDLARFCRLSPHSCAIARDYCDIAFQPHRCLEKFLDRDQTAGLFAVLQNTGAIISGSVAMQFFTREVSPDCVLDLYVDRFHTADLFAFVRGLGYVYMPTSPQPDSLGEALARAVKAESTRAEFLANKEALLDTFVFEHFAYSSKVVRVMVAVHSPIDAVLDFPSTVTMNFLTYRAAYSLYPRGTFISKTGVCFNGSFRSVSIQFKRRGWDLRSIIEDEHFLGLGREVTSKMRYVGDEYTWTINFDKSDPQIDPILFHSWSMTWTHVQLARARPQMHRQFYVDPYNSLLARVFANSALRSDFTHAVTSIDPTRFARTDIEVLQAVLRSGHLLFDDRPPADTDSRFITDFDKRAVCIYGIDQLALSSVGPTDLLPEAFNEITRSLNEYDDIVCTGISKKERNVEVRASRMQVNARLLDYNRNGQAVPRRHEQLPPPKRRRLDA